MKHYNHKGYSRRAKIFGPCGLQGTTEFEAESQDFKKK